MAYPVPEHKWYEFIDYLTRMDEELGTIIKQLNDIIVKMDKVTTSLETIVNYIQAPAPIPTPITLPGMPREIISIPVPVKVREVRTYNVGSTDVEITLEPPVYLVIRPKGGDIYFNKIKTTSTPQNFYLSDGQILIIYLAAEENRFYIRAVSGTVTVYVMLLEPKTSQQ